MFQLPPQDKNINAGVAINSKKCKCKLFTPIKIKNTVIKNRIFLSPMCQSGADSSGKLNALHLIHYGALAHRGAGLIMLENTAVLKDGRNAMTDIGLWNDDQIESYKPLVDMIHFYGSVAGIQLNHGDKMTSNGNRIDITELSVEELKEIIKAFGDAAGRANATGTDVIEICVPFEFLSLEYNRRTDAYGGSFENRIRFCTEVVESVKTQWPKEKAIFLRFPCYDWVETDWETKQIAHFGQILEELGVDFIDCTLNFLSPDQDYHLKFAQALKSSNPTTLQVGLTGSITSGRQAEDLLQRNDIDAVSVGRAFLADSLLVFKWAHDLGVEVTWSKQLDPAKRLVLSH